MMKNILITVLIIAGLFHGWNYLFSNQFQDLADEKEWTWTCKLNKTLANKEYVFSDYDRSLYFLEKIKERCPKSDLIPRVEYDMALCVQKQGYRQDAREMFRVYAEKYAGTQLADRALKKYQTLEQQR